MLDRNRGVGAEMRGMIMAAAAAALVVVVVRGSGRLLIGRERRVIWCARFAGGESALSMDL